jgi:hypothetical protein
MKKIIFISIGVVLLATGGYFLLRQTNNQDQKLDNDVAQELGWSGHFPEVVPEYTGGEIKEITTVDPEQSRFKEEVVAVVEETSREELDEYVEQLTQEGWMITYESPGERTFYTTSLSFEEYTTSISFNSEEGSVTLTTYVVQE